MSLGSPYRTIARLPLAPDDWSKEGYVQMTAADEMGFDNQFEEQLRAVVKEASLQQPTLVEDLHGSEDVQTVLSRHLDQETSERTAINDRLQAIESRLQAIESAQ
jgi:fatty acid/phospholipid biosynthesis enzyme